MDQEAKEIVPPSFTLYPLTTHDLKACYQSQHYKIVCTVNGPSYDRKHTQLEPLFHVNIANNSSCSKNNLTAEHLVRLGKKIQQVLRNVMIPNKYQRMVFQINMEIIETHPYNPASFLLSPLLNLLSYACALRCLETISSFACSAVILRGEKHLWQFEEQGAQQNDRVLVLCTQGRDKLAILLEYSGEFNYVEYEKLSGIAEETNNELLRFQSEKVGEVFDLFHQ